MGNKNKAQVTIFIILGVAIVLLLLFLFFRENIPFIGTEVTPIDKVQECIQDSVNEAVDKLRVQGGDLDPEFYYSYGGKNIAYLCYTEEYYKTCVMQRPMLKNHIEKEIAEEIAPIIDACVDSLKDLERKGYEVSIGEKIFAVSLVPDNILIDVLVDIKVKKGEEIESYKRLSANVGSSMYELVMVSSSILNWEARYGDAETTGYMVYYPSLKVEKMKQGDGTTIYTITDRNSEENFIFASRSLPWPPGYIA